MPTNHSSPNGSLHDATCDVLSRLPIDREMPEWLIYQLMERFVMSCDKMKTFGYPIPEEESDEGKVTIPSGFYPSTVNYFNSNQRTCSRCKTVFQVKDDGTPVVRKKCHYHRGFLRTNHGRTPEYSCCKHPMASAGCLISDSHIVDGSGHPDFDRGFKVTQPKQLAPGTSAGIYALDCEMCSTSIGTEVTKVTVVNHLFQVVYESLVKPKNPILDYNTVFSGLREGDLDNVKVTLEDVQAELLHLFNDRTILIGHALRNDLKVLKIAHMKVIDTEDVFPHNKGLPYTRSLKRIVEEQFRMSIQKFDHDSKQDAIACMNLMLRQVVELLRKWTLTPSPPVLPQVASPKSDQDKKHVDSSSNGRFSLQFTHDGLPHALLPTWTIRESALMPKNQPMVSYDPILNTSFQRW